MQQASCSRDELVAAFGEASRRLAERRTALWGAYLDATGAMSARQYDEDEPESWSILCAAIAGIDAEERTLDREYRRRLATIDGPGVAA